MIAALWNALLERHETIRRRTIQRQAWWDSEGKRHVGESCHALVYETVRYKRGERHVVKPTKGRPKPFTAFDMQNEITWMLNELPEWRELSCWSALRVATMLDHAFLAFYSRAANGAGASAGYPRFKRPDRHSSIPHRFASGCKLVKDPRHRTSWKLTLKGVPGAIHARGALPGRGANPRPAGLTAGVKWTDADVIWRDDCWWLSACVLIEPRREARGKTPIRVEFGVIDGLARVNGRISIPDGIPAIQAMQTDLDRMKSERDQLWPRNKPHRDDETFREAQREIGRLETLLRRRRNDALHKWTNALVKQASKIAIKMPSIKQHTASPRGSERDWGAQVETVSTLNRHVLSYAPAMAAAMLAYKAQEAGIPCVSETTATPEIAAGGEMVRAGKAVRKLRKRVKHVFEGARPSNRDLSHDAGPDHQQL